MRFMLLVIPKGYEKAAPGTMPDAKIVAAMMKYNESLQHAGVLLSLDGLQPPSMGARVSFVGGTPKVTDGPFIETKEVVGGYWMIQVKSKEEAIAWASRAPMPDGDVIEVRLTGLCGVRDCGSTRRRLASRVVQQRARGRDDAQRRHARNGAQGNLDRFAGDGPASWRRFLL